MIRSHPLDALPDDPPVGGKAASLARLRAAGLPVCDGRLLLPDAAAALAASDEAEAWAERELSTLSRPWIVRSSAAAEDTAEASLAGVFESVRDVAGPGQLAAAVAAVLASGADAAARGLAAAGPIAVLIQPQLACQAGGVLFTRHPDDEAAMLCEVGAGPEQVVAGGEASSLTLRREGGAIAAGASPHLGEAQARELAALGLRVEAAAGGPQDIEWALADGALWLLQARPIVAAARQRGTIWTMANAQEALPDPVTPLSWTTLEPLVARGLDQAYAALGLETPEEPALRLIEGRPYFNAAAFRRFATSIPGLPEDLFDALLFGESKARAQAKPLGPRALLRLLRSRVGRRAAWLALRTLPGVGQRLDAAARQIAAQARRWPAPGLEVGAAAQQWRTLERAIFSALRQHVIGTALAGGYHELTMLFGRWCDLDDAALLELLAPPTGTVHRQLAELLERLAAGIERNPPLRQRLREHPDGSLLHGDPVIGHLWAELEREYAHLAPGAAELSTPRDRERPERMIQAAMRLIGARPLPPVRLSPPTAPISGWRGWLLTHLARRARRFHPYRDRVKLAALMLFEPLRRLALESGQALAAEGRLPEPELVFYLERDELLALLDDPTARAPAELEARRQARRRQLAATAVPRYRQDEAGLAPLPSAPPGAVLQGTPAAPGQVEGAARVLTSLDQAETLQRGEILVAPSADPAWVSLFVLAGGAVLGTGSRLSHAALMARELGVPCVVGVERACERIRDGERLRLIGETGELVRLD